MRQYLIKTHPSTEALPKEEQFAWKLAELATGNKTADDDVIEMIGNRVIDNAAVAIASMNRAPVKAARQQALAHPREGGALLFGMPLNQAFECEWAAWANNVAVRELDFHDTFLAADYAHPADSIPALLAVAQQKGKNGRDLLLGILTAYEVHIDLVKGICLHEFKKDHVGHLAPAAAAGLGTLLKLDTDTVFQAINQALHLSFSTRQSRKGEISSWKAYAPAFAGKLAVEAVDRAMRGERSPTPIYEGEDGIIAWMLGGKKAQYKVELPLPGESCRAIMESYTKEHSAEYQAQSLIDIAIKLHARKIDLSQIKNVVIHTSHHTHYVIGTGANDPQKMDPHATRETLDHSAMYILAVAWEDGGWHHIKSYTPERANRPSTVELWRKISTVEEENWTKAYHSQDPSRKCFGGEVRVHMKDGSCVVEKLDNARAHANGERPFKRKEYINKFNMLTEGLVEEIEIKRFLDLVKDLPRLDTAEIRNLNIVARKGLLEGTVRDDKGIF